MADTAKQLVDLVDLSLLGKFKEKQDKLFQDKLDEKEALGTAAKLVGNLTLSNGTAVKKDNVTEWINFLYSYIETEKGDRDKADTLLSNSIKTLKELVYNDSATNGIAYMLNMIGTITQTSQNVADKSFSIADLTTDAKDKIVNAINEVDANADAAKAAADKAQQTADKNAQDIAAITGTGAGGIDKKIETAIKGVTDSIGDKETLTTDEKGTIVGAINEVDANVDALKTSSAVTVDFDDSTRVYKISQGGTLLGTMNIGKDLVVSSGEVKEVETKGTCLVLTLTSGDVVEIPVASLIDIYTAADGAKEVQIAIDASTRKVSATLVDAGISTAKIADKAVTKAKLADAVQTSLGKADSAVQKADVVEGATDGTISVQGTEVTVHGFAAVKSTADAAKTTADKLDGEASVAGSVKAQIAASETATKAAVKVDTDALAGRATNLETRAKALEDWKATVGVATEEDLEELFK